MTSDWKNQTKPAPIPELGIVLHHLWALGLRPEIRDGRVVICIDLGTWIAGEVPA